MINLMKFLLFSVLFTTLSTLDSSEHNDRSSKCVCVPKFRCNSKYSFLIEPRFVKNPKCSAGKVCCFIDENGGEDKKISQKTSHPKPNLNCGIQTKISSYKRIIYSAFRDLSIAREGEFPWQAAILKQNQDSYLFSGSGVLIDKNKILTAAHLVDQSKPSDLNIRLGDINLQNDKDSNGQDVEASKIVLHPEYNEVSLTNDFAIICLNNDLVLNNYIFPACLPNQSLNYSLSKNCEVSGWGKDKKLNGKYSSTLRKVQLNLIDRQICEKIIQNRLKVYDFKLDNSFVCAGGEKDLDACKGDGGGPLACKMPDGKYILRGIVSWGISCGEEGIPGMYSNVENSIDWIQSISCNKVESKINENNFDTEEKLNLEQELKEKEKIYDEENEFDDLNEKKEHKHKNYFLKNNNLNKNQDQNVMENVDFTNKLLDSFNF